MPVPRDPMFAACCNSAYRKPIFAKKRGIWICQGAGFLEKAAVGHNPTNDSLPPSGSSIVISLCCDICLREPSIGSIDTNRTDRQIRIVVSPEGNDSNTAHIFSLKCLAQQSAVGLKDVERNPHFLPRIRRIKFGLIQLPWKNSPFCSEVQVVGLRVAAHLQNDALRCGG